MIEKLEKHYWFALRVTYSREMKVKKILDGLGVESFIPMRSITVEEKGSLERVWEPAIHNLLFVHTSKEKLDQLKKETCLSTQIRYIMDIETHRPLYVPDRQMENFIAVSEKNDQQILYLNAQEVALKKGDKVRIKEGVWKGVEGKLVRIKKGLRVVVSISGITAVATASLSPSLVEKID